MKKFSIITVCLNVENTIEDTILSVLEQTCTDYEYIIKDGVSSDKTLQIAESFISAFAEKGVSYRIISQPDGGIYDAINQAANEAQGEWVLYMNAGDLFADSFVLEMVKQSGKLEKADIVYGDRINSMDKRYIYQKAHPLEMLRERLPFCHQSVFAKKSLYDQFLYSLNYRLCSDYLFFYDRYQEGKIFAYLPIAISIYDRHGASSNKKAVWQEILKIHEDMPVRDEEMIQILKEKVEACDKKPPVFRRILKWIIPSPIRKEIWKRIQRNYGWKTAEEFQLEKERNNGRVNKKINQ